MSGSPANDPVGKLAALLEALRVPTNPDSEEGRAQLRHRAIALTVLASVLSRTISMVTLIAAVPLTLHYLGAERYGMWMALSAFSALLSFADFGIGNSVLTAVAHSAGRRDSAELRRQVSSAYAAMGAIAAILLALLALAYPFIAWDRLFNVASAAAVAEAGPAAVTFLAILALTTPLGLVLRIQLGLQQGFRASLWQGAASLASLVALVLAIWFEASLPWLVLAMAGAPVLVNLVNTLDFFGRRHPELRPSFARFDLGAIRRLSSDGALFLILQVCTALLFQVNALIIAQVLGAKAVAAYAVPERMFAVVASVVALVLTPLWPAYGDAAAHGDHRWARRTLRRSLVLGIGGAGVLSALLVLAGPQIIRWWVGDAVTVTLALLAGLGLWRVIEAGGNAGSLFLNGVNRLRIQVAAALACVVVSIPLRLWWAQEFGLPGVIWATIASYVLVALPFLVVAVRRELARMEFAGSSA